MMSSGDKESVQITGIDSAHAAVFIMMAGRAALAALPVHKCLWACPVTLTCIVCLVGELLDHAPENAHICG